MALMLCTSAFAKTLDIYTFEGNEGLVDRSEPVGSGDVLNIKTTYLDQTKDNYKNDILNKGITINGDGEISGSAAEEGGARVTIDGRGWDGFYMDASASSEMKNLELTCFGTTAIQLGEYVEGEGGPNDVQTNGNISPKLTLTDVNIYDNGRIVVLGIKHCFYC